MFLEPVDQRRGQCFLDIGFCLHEIGLNLHQNASEIGMNPDWVLEVLVGDIAHFGGPVVLHISEVE